MASPGLVRGVPSPCFFFTPAYKKLASVALMFLAETSKPPKAEIRDSQENPMTIPIRRAGVIGAGVMGSGIAAHFANAGLEVVLLDIVPPNLKDDEKTKKSARDRFAAGGLEKALKSKPAAFFAKNNARLVRTGNTEDDLGLLANCDLVIEAIIEQLEHKRSLFEKLEKVLPSHAIVASNTSGLRIEDMLVGR